MMKKAAVAVIVPLACAAVGGPIAAQASSGGSAHSAATPDTAAARKFIAPYLKRPTPFPVDTPLKRKLSRKYTVAVPVVGTPVGGLLGDLWKAAGKVAGVKVFTVKAGTTPSTTEAAFSTIIAQKPDALPVGGIEPSFFAKAVKRAQATGTVVTATSLMYPKRYGIRAATYDERIIALDGKLLANWVIAKHASKANAVFYIVPELAFTKVMASSFVKEMKRACPACPVRTANIPITQYSTAPSRIVSDLQSKPGTNSAVFGAIEAAAGAPAALKTAGIKVDILGQGTDPASLENLKNGRFSAMVAFDAAVLAWTTLDEAFRLSLKQPLTKLERASSIPIQLLEPKTVPANISHGFSAYPDFAKRFAKLWNPKKTSR